MRDLLAEQSSGLSQAFFTYKKVSVSYTVSFASFGLLLVNNLSYFMTGSYNALGRLKWLSICPVWLVRPPGGGTLE